MRFVTGFPNLNVNAINTDKVTKFVHKVKLNPDTVPVQVKRNQVPFALRNKVSLEIKRLLSDDIIEPVDASEWISPVVIVSKKESEAIRLCVDLTRVNKCIVVDSHPLPVVDEIFNSLSGAQVFSTLDLKGAYNHVPLHEDSRDLTCFIVDDGLFRYKRICYGLASAPSFFQKMMSIILQGVKGCSCYLDDILVYGSSMQEHDENLN